MGNDQCKKNSIYYDDRGPRFDLGASLWTNRRQTRSFGSFLFARIPSKKALSKRPQLHSWGEPPMFVVAKGVTVTCKVL
jgi:hypothetical protein